MHIFLWNDENVEHLAQHGIEPDDFAEAFENGEEVEDPRGKHTARIGYDRSGRLLYGAYESVDGIEIIPVTAFEIDE